jgi:serine/threonine-protein kinase
VLGQIDLASQSVFAGRYRVLRRIAAGGMGAVFEVVHVETQRRRALKVMLPELLANRQLRERFQMEARITANVESEYIVDVFDAGIDDATGMPFLVMELLNGEDLAKVLERAGRLGSEQVVTYLRQIASALDKTHAAGIVHRDLKPENLFLTHREDGTPRVKILDFGISKVVTEAGTGANNTRGLGTPLYMAPEQVLAQTISPATDLYALGLIAYTLLVGLPYWQSEAETFDNPISFVVHTSKGATDSAVRRAALVGHSFPPAFDAWFRRATNLDTGARFRSAAELVGALAESLGVAHLPYLGAPLSPDSTGAVLRVAHATAAAETMAARTAPGTGFDRKSTLSGSSARPKTGLWLGLAAAGLVGSALAAAFALRSHSPADAPSSEIKSAAANPATDSAAPKFDSVAPIGVVASASASASAANLTPPPTAEAHTATPAARGTSNAKSPSAPSRPSAPKPGAASAHKVSAPKYTRD